MPSEARKLLQEKRQNQKLVTSSSVSVPSAPAVGKDKVNEEWLLGTHVTTPKKAQEAKKKSKKKKKNKGAVKEEQKVYVDKDSSDEDIAEDTPIDSYYKSLEISDDRGDDYQVTGMGLDSFSPTGQESKVDSSDPFHWPEMFDSLSDAWSTVESQRSPKKTLTTPAESLKPSAPSVRQGMVMSGISPINAVPTRRSTAVSSEPPTAANSLELFSMPEPPPLPLFLAERYEHTFACSSCYEKVGEGVDGFCLWTNLQHSCSGNILLVRPRGITKRWMKIRQRIINPKFPNPALYRLCHQFQSGYPCTIGEERCNFAHSAAEVEFWTLDRDNQFSLAGFTHHNVQAIVKHRTQGPDHTVQHSIGQPLFHKPPSLMNIPPSTTGIQNGEDYDEQKFSLKCVYCDVSCNSSRQWDQHCCSERHLQNVHQSRYDVSPRLVDHPSGVPHHGEMPFVRPPMSGLPPGPPPGGHFPGMFQPNYPPPPFYQTPPIGVRPPLPAPHTRPPMVLPHEEHMPIIPGKMENPLTGTEYKLVCEQCFTHAGGIGIYFYSPPQGGHICAQNILAFKVSPHHWVKVRERTNHRPFKGAYVLCRHVRNNQTTGEHPMVPEDSCAFAHSDLEKIIWTKEKNEEFNILEFILVNRSGDTKVQGFSLAEILEKHGGSFKFICKACFMDKPPVISFQSQNNPIRCSGQQQHPWDPCKVLTHFKEQTITPINPRYHTGKEAYFKICHYLQFCQRKAAGICVFAHSAIERDIWMLERETEISREDIVTESLRILSLHHQKVARAVPSHPVAPARVQSPGPATMAQRITSTSAVKGDKLLQRAEPMKKPPVSCPYKVRFVCGLCFRQGQVNTQAKGKDKCSGSGYHTFEQNKICHLLTSSGVIIRALPKKIPHGPRGFNFKICKHVQKGHKCEFALGTTCQFAHFTEEINVWQWMCENEALTLDKLVEASMKADTTSLAKMRIVKGEASAEVKVTKKSVMPTARPQNVQYCSYCGVQCNSGKQWDEHCTSDRHVFNLNSDKEQQWNYRSPPWGVRGGQYQLCNDHASGGICRYSHVPDIYNMCQNAHTQEELDEWVERYEWRQMKRDMAMKEKVFSYMDELLDHYNKASCGTDVLSEKVPGVEVTCLEDFVQYKNDKKDDQIWTFNVKPQNGQKLVKVALLHNKDRLHFSLRDESDQACQVTEGDIFELESQPGTYQVPVYFTSGLFGSFYQWIVFDFGTRPILYCKVSVEVGTHEVQTKVQQLRQQLKFDRWTSSSHQIIPFDLTASRDDFHHVVMQQYREPSSADTVITQDSVVRQLNRHNYVHKMHKLLQIEEVTRRNITSRYNLCSDILLTNKIEEETYIFSQKGELFARVSLNNELSEDTDSGKLILTSVTHVLLAPRNSSSNNVYEAVIVNKEQFDYDGRGKDYIYLCLSPHCVRELGLQVKQTLSVEIQFMMNRLPFCLMHYAVDQLSDTSIVFPDVSKIGQILAHETPYEVSSQVMNSDQLRVVKYALAVREPTAAPPVIVYGPFGTGKTECLAQSVMILKTKEPEAKILICTHSNSAADLYIIRHLDEFVQRRSNTDMLRVYFKDRRVNTVNHIVRQYCLFSPDGAVFADPTSDIVMRHSIVIVTLSSSLLLSRLKLHGYFTHIFIDEGAQAFECETIMPLSLSSKNTCVVIAGDHMQMSPKVYSLEAQQQKFHQSLLERLFHYYESHADMSQSSKLNILLSWNYRSKMEILRFVSAIFYGGPDRLVAMSGHPDITSIKPLTFYVAQGHEVQDSNSTSFYNMAEVDELVDRVADLWNKWPVEWGPRDPGQIGVITPYTDQVNKIRQALRKKNFELSRVTVERVMNVQGKEFRALFLSTVRTHNLQRQHREKANAILNECDGEGDLGFFTDQKLLNTALTRAQSMVAVVGEPIALCSLGDCTPVWRTFLKHCQKMGSLFPQSVTLDSIRLQVFNLMNSLQEPDIDSQPKSLFPLITKNKLMQTIPEMVQEFTDNFEEVLKISKDDVIKGVVMETDKSDIDMEDIVLNEEGGLVVASNKHNKIYKKKNKMSTIHSDLDIDSEDTSLIEARVTHEMKREQLRNLVESNPKRFKHCIINIEEDVITAEVISADSDVISYVIPNTQCCGPAWHLDEVIIEVSSNKATGLVRGIIHHNNDPASHLLICKPDPVNPGSMLSISDKAPPIYTLIGGQDVDKTNQGELPVYTSKDGKMMALQHYEQVTGNKMFIMKYLLYNSQLQVHIGVVVGILSPSSSVEQCRRLLGISCGLPSTNLSPASLQEMDNMYDTFRKFPEVFASSRQVDLRDQLTFSVPSFTSSFLETAISFSNLGNDMCGIGIHVSDVSSYLLRTQHLNAEAKDRGIMFHDVNDSSHKILPDKLLEDICSLRADEDRLSLSVILKVSIKGKIAEASVKTSIINSNSVLSHESLENIINKKCQSVQPDVFSAIQKMYTITSLLRKSRLGNAATQSVPSDVHTNYPKAYCLLEEMCITANQIMAQALLRTHPSVVPFLCQMPPSVRKINVWKEAHSLIAKQNCTLSRPFLESGKTCQCLSVCSCVEESIGRKVSNVETIDMQTSEWGNILQAAKANDFYQLSVIFLTPINHPQMAVAKCQLDELQSMQSYVCSIEVGSDKLMSLHYQSNLAPMTHFTAPMENYLDIFTQQLIISASSQVAPKESMEQIVKLCERTTALLHNSKRYENGNRMMNVAASLQKLPLVVYGVIGNLMADRIQLFIPKILDSPVMMYTDSLQTVNCEYSGVIVRGLKLEWSWRIYDVDTASLVKIDNSDNVQQLNTNKYILQVQTYDWTQMLQCVMVGDADRLYQQINAAGTRAHFPSLDEQYATEVTSEMKPGIEISKLNCNFGITLQTANVVKVQLGAVINEAVVKPVVQLLNLTPKLDICLEHYVDPLSFVYSPSHNASKIFYQSEEDYQQSWLSVLNIEASFESIKSNTSILIRNLPIQWSEVEDFFIGQLNLPVNFCKERKIYFNTTGITDFDEITTDMASDFICIRYNDVTIENMDGTQSEPFCWLGHGVTMAAITKDDIITVVMRLHKSNTALPRDVLHPSGASPRTCTLELINKQAKYVIMEKAVRQLPYAADMCKCVALGWQIPPTGVVENGYNILEEREGFPKLDSSQLDAIRKGILEPFSVIEGPAGSGKTEVLLRLVMEFADKNRQAYTGDPKQCVMVCATNEDILDVITEKLMEVKTLNVIRAYSKDVEDSEFPLPGQTSQIVGKPLKDVFKSVALHHVIRKAGTSMGDQINIFNKFITNFPDITAEQLAFYEDLISKAEVDVLAQADVIIITCVESVNDRLKTTNIKQILIDQAQMITEPEIIVPLMRYDVGHVVLLGDRCQSQPVVNQPLAKTSGLAVSLFERYVINDAVTLLGQYRMNAAIRDVPYKCFYEDHSQHESDNIQVKPLLVSTHGLPLSTIFCHVPANSRDKNGLINIEECKQVINLVDWLVNRRNVSSDKIGILSFYSNQCSHITSELERSSKVTDNVDVMTIMESHGKEWDYVIVSTVQTVPELFVEKKAGSKWKERHLGELQNHSLLLTALTRGRKGLIILGNKYLLALDDMWKYLLTEYKMSEMIMDSNYLVQN